MKKSSRAAVIGLCTVLSVSVYADLAGTFKTITLDGSLADWSNPGDVFYDSSEIGAGAPAASSYDEIYLANDAANLYIGLDTSDTGGGDVNNTWTRNIFLDTDADGSTGFDAGWMTHGYDYLIQYGNSGTTYSIFEFTGASQGEWSWGTWVGLIAYSYNDDVAELSAPLSMLGLSGGDDVVVELNVSGTGTTAETWASVSEATAETYTVAIPEPATLGMVTLLGGAILFIRRRLVI